MTPRHRFDEASPIETLTDLCLHHPAWNEAARYLEEGASSNIYIASQPEAVWHLVRRANETHLEAGPARDPDLVFRFTREAVASLANVEGDVGDFAVRLFHLIVEVGDDAGVEIRIAAPFSRLVRRGYLSLLVAGGLRVLAFGTAHGVRTLHELRRLVERMQQREPAVWEIEATRSESVAHSADGGGLRWRLRRVARELATQHDHLREIVGEINAALDAGDSERTGAAMARYGDALVAHFTLEENVVFPALHGAAERNGETVVDLLRDHVSLFAEVERLIADATDAGSADWRARFYQLRRALALHESREEGLVNAQSRPLN